MGNTLGPTGSSTIHIPRTRPQLRPERGRARGLPDIKGRGIVYGGDSSAAAMRLPGVLLGTATSPCLSHHHSVDSSGHPGRTSGAVNSRIQGSMRYLSHALVLVALLGVGATSASAQQPRDVPAQTASSPDDRRDSGNWGWVGLVGLIGLAGMKRKELHARHTVRTDAQPSTSR